MVKKRNTQTSLLRNATASLACSAASLERPWPPPWQQQMTIIIIIFFFLKKIHFPFNSFYRQTHIHVALAESVQFIDDFEKKKKKSQVSEFWVFFWWGGFFERPYQR